MGGAQSGDGRGWVESGKPSDDHTGGELPGPRKFSWCVGFETAFVRGLGGALCVSNMMSGTAHLGNCSPLGNGR